LQTVRYVSPVARAAPFEAAFRTGVNELATDRNAAVANSDVVITATPGGGRCSTRRPCGRART
jgi:ornithine cyclodeaminase